MKMSMNWTGGLLVLMATGALLPAQAGQAVEAAGGPQQEAQGASATASVPVDAGALVLEIFHAQRMHPPALFEAVKRLCGRKLAVRRAEGVSLVDNIAVVESAFLIQDTREMATVILGALKLLDQLPPGEPRAAGAFVRSACTLRYIGDKEVTTVLNGWRRHIRLPDGSTISNVSFLKERGVVDLYDTKENVTAMTAILQSLDKPLAQVLVTCHLIEAVPDVQQGGAPLPEALTRQLGQLTGHTAFRSVATGMVRTTVRSEQKVELIMGSDPEEQATLSFHPASFDSADGVLTMEQLHFSCNRAGGGKPGHRSLCTNASTQLRAGEFAVVGASGSTPMLAVLHMTLIR